MADSKPSEENFEKERKKYIKQIKINYIKVVLFFIVLIFIAIAIVASIEKEHETIAAIIALLTPVAIIIITIYIGKNYNKIFKM